MNSKIKYIAVVCGAGLGILCAAVCPRPNANKPTEIAREIPIVETVESTAANLPSESEPETEPETEYEVTYTTMYATTALNIRLRPEVCEETYITTVPINTEFTVLDYDELHMWDVIVYEDSIAYVASEFLSFEPVEIPAIKVPSITYYGIWAGQYYHFTPEEWDAKKGLPIGTTRAWQQYLYMRLQEYQIEWFYTIAVAQAMQESGMNPLNNQDHHIISWLGSEPTYDCGLFSFKTKYWNSAYGDVCDYHANINAYIDRIAPYLIGAMPHSEEVINQVLRQHYNSGNPAADNAYVQHVRNRLPELWEFN